MPPPVATAERAAHIVREQQRALAKRVAGSLKSGGGLGFTAHTTTAEELDYYKRQLFDPVTGQLNPQAWAALVQRVGAKGASEIVLAMVKDWQQQTGLDVEQLMAPSPQLGGTYDNPASAAQPAGALQPAPAQSGDRRAGDGSAAGR